VKYSKELHDRVRQNLRMFDYPRFDDGDIDCLLNEIDRLNRYITALETCEVRSKTVIKRLRTQTGMDDK